jgi:hypothetical protein
MARYSGGRHRAAHSITWASVEPGGTSKVAKCQPAARPIATGVRMAPSEVTGPAGYLLVWSSISAEGALRLIDSIPLSAPALLS